MLTLPERFDNESEAQERHEHDVEFVEATEDAPKAFETTEQPFDLVAAPVPGFAIPSKYQISVSQFPMISKFSVSSERSCGT